MSTVLTTSAAEWRTIDSPAKAYAVCLSLGVHAPFFLSDWLDSPPAGEAAFYAVEGGAVSAVARLSNESGSLHGELFCNPDHESSLVHCTADQVISDLGVHAFPLFGQTECLGGMQ